MITNLSVDITISKCIPIRRLLRATTQPRCAHFSASLPENRSDENFILIPPFFTAGGKEISVGRKVFINQNCTFYDLAGLRIGDDVLIGPNVSIITTGHPVEPGHRRGVTIGKPIVIERNVWIVAGAIIIGGVTAGENSVVAAGSVVTKNVPPNTLVGGNPARIIRAVETQPPV